MVEVLPHFDRFASWMPDLVLRRVAGAPAGVHVVGVDEDTALVGGLPGWDGAAAAPGTTWRVHGRQSVWLLDADGRRELPSGSGRRPRPQGVTSGGDGGCVGEVTRSPTSGSTICGAPQGAGRPRWKPWASSHPSSRR